MIKTKVIKFKLIKSNQDHDQNLSAENKNNQTKVIKIIIKIKIIMIKLNKIKRIKIKVIKVQKNHKQSDQHQIMLSLAQLSPQLF